LKFLAKLKKRFVEYFKREFNSKFFFKILFITISFYFCQEYVVLGIDKFIISILKVDQIKQSPRLDIFFILIFVVAICYLGRILFFKKLKPDPNSIATIVLVTLCYCFVIRFSGLFWFLRVSFFKEIAYLDILFFVFVLIISKFKYYGTRPEYESFNGFVEDNFHPEKKIDLLSRERYAYQLGIKILDTESLEKAFVIAINSPWGFGKTSFLLMIEAFFDKKNSSRLEQIIKSVNNSYSDDAIAYLTYSHKNTIVIRFNPWKNFDDKKMIKDFFDELSNSLGDFDTSLSENVRSYGEYLSKLDNSTIKKMVELGTNIFEEKNTLTQLFKKINKSIEISQKRIIVFIDDLDRLTGDEIIDILKLIRNTANFKNFIFLAAYDHNYILNTIDKKKLISNKEDYLHKIVQLEIALPIFQKNIIYNFLNEEFKRFIIFKNDLVFINRAVEEISSISVPHKRTRPEENGSDENIFQRFYIQNTDETLFLQVIQNIRDATRFLNSFKLTFEVIGSVGDLYEIILLELLKVKYLSIYELISKKRFISVNNGLYKFNVAEFDAFVSADTLSTVNVKFSDIDIIESILDALFSRTRTIFFRSVRHPTYFDFYFSYQVPNSISLTKIETALKIGIEEVITVIEKIRNEEAYNDFVNFIDSQRDFASKEDFEIILKVLFYIAKYDNG